MYTENSSQPHGHGEILLNTFTPYSKNPPIAKLFRIIGYADEMGSGMRNTYKYTKLYSGALPKFEEGDVFTTTIPLDNVAELAKKLGVSQTTIQKYISSLKKASLLIRHGEDYGGYWEVNWP